MDAYTGTILAFGFNFAPYNWALCAGQIMAIQQNTTLFALLGTQYGGNGTSTFGLPNLQGSLAIGQGQGPGLQPYVMGESGGTETESLTIANLPAHNHTTTVTKGGTPTTATLNAVNAATSVLSPAGALLGGSHATAPQYVAAGAATVPMAPTQITAGGGGLGGPLPTVTLAATGQGIPIQITQPTLTVSYCICMYGTFPPRQ